MRSGPGVLVGLALVLGGCSTLEDEDEGEVPETEIPRDRQSTIEVQHGWVSGKRVEYFKLGMFVPDDTDWFPSYDKDGFPGMPVNQIYVWEDASGKASLSHAQLPIIDGLPLQAKYSDFLEVVSVKAPDDYEDNQIKSRGTLLQAEYELTPTGKVINCPVVGKDAKLASTSGAPLAEYRKIKVWYRGRTTYCIMVDGGSALLKTGARPVRIFKEPITEDTSELRVAAEDGYTLLTKAFSGADQVTEIPVPKNDIFRHLPGHSAYTPLIKIWDVTVPSDYKVPKTGGTEGVTSYWDLFPIPDFTDPRIVERSPETFCNCPIVLIK